jgi:hypothetical protein
MATAVTDLTRGVDAALAAWRQGDVILNAGLAFVHLALLSNPLTEAAEEVSRELAGQVGADQAIVTTEPPGFIVLTQSCDLIRPCHLRPLVELAPLIVVPPSLVEDVRRLKRPNFAYVPALADQSLVADLECTMTVEKAVLATLQRQPGVTTDREAADFAQALGRKRQRFAFPDAFNIAIRPLLQRLDRRAGRNSDEGRHVDALIEIRAAAEPAWQAANVAITLWLIKSHDPEPQDWPKFAAEWGGLIADPGAVYTLDGQPRVVRLEDMKASEYVASYQLDLDQLTPAA